MVESVDASVGRVVDGLSELGIAETTAVVFVSDNGGLSTLPRRSFNQATSNMPLRAGKGWLYEGGVRAPLIVAWPGQTDEGTVVQAPAMSTDLLPTLLEIAGIAPASDVELDGVSLVTAMAGAATQTEAVANGPADPHAALYWHFPHYHGSGNRPGGAVRVGDLKLIEWFEDGQVELYDLAADPGEQHDLAAERPEDVARLIATLGAWRLRVDANMPTPHRE
jgi:arylsulfatase A-like enzyme